MNLKYSRGAIGSIDSYAQALYGYDVRTEVIGSKGSIFIGSLQQTPAPLPVRESALPLSSPTISLPDLLTPI